MNTAAPFTVLNVVLDSGERLPCLVEAATWIPVRVAMRWAVRYRRYRVQSSTLANNLRALAHVYRWARETAGYDLDDHLTQGQSLRGREIESLANRLRTKASGQTLDTGAYDHRLAVVEDFLKWSLDRQNRGGHNALSLEQLASERGWLVSYGAGIKTARTWMPNFLFWLLTSGILNRAPPNSSWTGERHARRSYCRKSHYG